MSNLIKNIVDVLNASANSVLLSMSIDFIKKDMILLGALCWITQLIFAYVLLNKE